MSNTILTADIIAAEALMVLDNNLVMANQVFREYEGEYSKSVNGYKPGATITINRPTDFTVRDGNIASAQDVKEGTTTIVVNKQKGVDFEFTSTDLTLNIKDLSKRVIKPAMVQLANQVDVDLMNLYKSVPNWVGAPAYPVSSFTQFALGPERLDEFAVPLAERSAVLTPSSHWSLLGSQTGLFINEAAKGAYREGSLGKLGGVETYMAQNVPTHTTGTYATSGAIEVDGAVTAATISYDAVKDTMTQTITMDGFTASAPVLQVGDVFTIEDVYAVNPVTKAPLSFLRQFTITGLANNSGNQVDVTFYPAMIWTGAFKTVAVKAGVTDLDGKDITPVGADATPYRQNMVFHRNAFALAMVPMVKPPGAVDVARKTYKGLSVRVIPVYDGTNDKSMYRLDILYGVKAIDPRLATRLSGASSS